MRSDKCTACIELQMFHRVALSQYLKGYTPLQCLCSTEGGVVFNLRTACKQKTSLHELCTLCGKGRTASKQKTGLQELCTLCERGNDQMTWSGHRRCSLWPPATSMVRRVWPSTVTLQYTSSFAAFTMPCRHEFQCLGTSISQFDLPSKKNSVLSYNLHNCCTVIITHILRITTSHHFIDCWMSLHGCTD